GITARMKHTRLSFIVTTKRDPSLTGSCRQGDHEACIQAVYPERRTKAGKRACHWACHKGTSINPSHRPTMADPRVTSRERSMNQHWYWAVWGKPVKTYTDESVIREPLTKEELWTRQATH